MDARCKSCSIKHMFHHYRGFQLSHQRCNCGGQLERINHNYDKYNTAGLYKSSSGYFFYDSKENRFILAAL